MTGEPAAPAGFADSLARLRGAQKSRAGGPLYSLIINRPLGRIFAAAAFQLRMTPNQVTAVSALFTYAGIIVLALVRPSWPAGVIIAALLVVGYALDSADGQLARLRGGGSLFGEWLDHTIDSLKVATIHLAVVIAWYRFFPGSKLWVLVPIAFCAANVVHFSGMLLTELLGRVDAASRGTKPAERPGSWLQSAIKLPSDYGVLCLAFVLLGSPVVFMVCYSVLAAGTIGYTALVIGRWARRIKQLDAARKAESSLEGGHV